MYSFDHAGEPKDPHQAVERNKEGMTTGNPLLPSITSLASSPASISHMLTSILHEYITSLRILYPQIKCVCVYKLHNGWIEWREQGEHTVAAQRSC
jgi:hypothetical protein